MTLFDRWARVLQAHVHLISNDMRLRNVSFAVGAVVLRVDVFSV
jgi:hypothetical protein